MKHLKKHLIVRLTKFEDGNFQFNKHNPTFEFHIRNEVRKEHGLSSDLFKISGNVILADFKSVRDLASKLNSKIDLKAHPEKAVKAGQLSAMGLIDEILHFMVGLYRRKVQNDIFISALGSLENSLGAGRIESLLKTFCDIFPPKAVYSGHLSTEDYLKGSDAGYPNRAMALEELLMLMIANLNPAFSPFLFLFDDAELEAKTVYLQAIEELRVHLAKFPGFGQGGQNLWDLLRAPALACPDSLSGQLKWIRENWGLLLQDFLSRLLTSLDVINEEDKPNWGGAPGPTEAYSYSYMQNEYERFSQDKDWMPRTVLMAKSTLVWLWQLSKKYKTEINRLDLIPDAELDELAERGFTGLWLIGLWERSNASRTIKQWKGNPEAAASAYSLYDYTIAGELGSWGALCNLRDRCAARGIRLGSDMVPNHTGIDSRWIMEHPDRFLQLDSPPYPQYKYDSGNLSDNPDVVVQIEDHYYDNTDCGVVFHHYDRRDNRHRYIYHGNDGTSMPWNDTAQIDFLNPEAREAVIQTIIGVCKQFSIVRFDAAMTLAKRHIQRLWYPEPGHGGDIASRAEHSISTEEFNRRIPNEFWREVVDRCAEEAPQTLLLAEAFWMMEGYFVRTLGMHRVYNSAFMNMLKKEENQKYRATIKNTLEFDPEILKRFVNFMNNPDEETAVAQFGKGDKYFGICTLMVTMPGLPMFGHGQIEGYEEKYGMEYRRAYRDETPDEYLVSRHEREIFPLMKKRMIFSGSADFCLFDLWTANGSVNENVFAYTNRLGMDRALVLFNNSFDQTSGWINTSSAAIPLKSGGTKQDSIAVSLSLHNDSSYFVLLNEQRCGKWFIRSSKEIFERGLFLHLNAYEAQVYINIQEVEDVSCKTWARLHAELNGAGISNPKEALEDMLLDEIFIPFCEMLKPEKLEDFRKSIIGDSPLSKETKKSVENFIKAACKFRMESENDPFAGEKNRNPLSVSAAMDAWEALYEAFAKAVKDAKAKTADPIVSDFYEKLVNGRKLSAFIYGWTILNICVSIAGEKASGAQAVTLFEYWHFDRKMRECLELSGIEGSGAYRAIEIAKAIMRRIKFDKSGARPEWSGTTSPASIVEKNLDSEDFRRLLCVNEWEGESWFNKEAFEEVIFRGAVFVCGFTGIKTASMFVKELTQAKDKSSYKIKELVKALKGKSSESAAKTSKTAAKPSKTTVSKAAATEKVKSSAAKPAAKKTAAAKSTSTKSAVPKTAAAKSTAAKSPAAKSTAKKPAAAKTASKKTETKKPASTKKTPGKK